MYLTPTLFEPGRKNPDMPTVSFYYVIRNNNDGSAAVDFYADKEAAMMAREIEDRGGHAFRNAGPQQIELEFDNNGKLLTPDFSAEELRQKLAGLPVAPPHDQLPETEKEPETTAEEFTQASRRSRPNTAPAPQEPDLSEILPTAAGKTIAFTGKMVGNRHRLQDDAAALGAHVASIINEKTDILVVGDDLGSSKVDKARDLGVTIITEKQWYELAARTAAAAKSGSKPSVPTP